MTSIQSLILQQDFTYDLLKKIIAEKGLTLKEWNDRIIITYPNVNRLVSSSTKVNYNDPFVRQCKGIILQKSPSEFKIVCYSMDKLLQSTDLKEDELKMLFDEADWQVEELIDGSLVKVYWYNDQWNVATNRCVEAQKARYSNYRTFSDYFQDAATTTTTKPLDYSKLNKHCTYSFVLCHPENRIITNHQVPKLVHVATRNLDTFEEVEEDIGIEKPLVMKMDWEMLQERLQTNPYYIPGYVLKTKDNRRIVFRGVNYNYVRELKGNGQNITHRYLQLQRENETKFQEFVNYFPECKWIDGQMENLAREAHTTYIDFFVKHEKSRINRDLWELMSELHTLYLKTTEPTSLVKVRQHLKSYPLDKLARLLKTA